jgi:acetyl-CoA carboxylase biotin carboxyl carrier protein
MDPEKIKTMIDAMAASDLSEMEFKEDGWTLRLVRHAGDVVTVAKASPLPLRQSRNTKATVPKSGPPSENAVLSPSFGVAYLRPSPDAPLFVCPGQAVVAGMTLCIIEAMKVFSELKADRDGTISAVLVSSGDEVEMGQALMQFA